MFRTEKKVIVFDFDGVLVDSNTIKYKEFSNIFKIDIDDARLNQIILSGKDRHDIIYKIHKEIYQRDGGTLNLDVFIKKYTDNVHAKILEVGIKESIIFFLRNNDKSMFINSATPKIELQLLCDDLHISNFFLKILGTPQTKEENFKYIFNEYNIKPSQIMFFGDMKSDKDAAKRVGVEFSPIFSQGSNLL